MEDDIRARRAEERQKKLRKIWKIARPVLVIILSLTIAFGRGFTWWARPYMKNSCSQ